MLIRALFESLGGKQCLMKIKQPTPESAQPGSDKVSPFLSSPLPAGSASRSTTIFTTKLTDQHRIRFSTKI